MWALGREEMSTTARLRDARARRARAPRRARASHTHTHTHTHTQIHIACACAKAATGVCAADAGWRGRAKRRRLGGTDACARGAEERRRPASERRRRGRGGCSRGEGGGGGRASAPRPKGSRRDRSGGYPCGRRAPYRRPARRDQQQEKIQPAHERCPWKSREAHALMVGHSRDMLLGAEGVMTLACPSASAQSSAV